MRIAVVSDIHGNRTAFEAVLADLKHNSPDLVLHGGDLADGGASPVEIVDRIRDLGWPGVAGNGEEMLAEPGSLEDFARPLTGLKPLFDAVREMAACTRELLGDDRLGWLRALPRRQVRGAVGLVHASPESAWRAPAADAGDEELTRIFGSLECAVAVHGHIHRPYVRTPGGLTVANSGSVGLPYDGDPRSSYLLVDDGMVTIRRVGYEVDREIRMLRSSPLPNAEWVASMLRSARMEPLPR